MNFNHFNLASKPFYHSQSWFTSVDFFEWTCLEKNQFWNCFLYNVKFILWTVLFIANFCSRNTSPWELKDRFSWNGSTLHSLERFLYASLKIDFLRFFNPNHFFQHKKIKTVTTCMMAWPFLWENFFWINMMIRYFSIK